MNEVLINRLDEKGGSVQGREIKCILEGIALGRELETSEMKDEGGDLFSVTPLTLHKHAVYFSVILCCSQVSGIKCLLLPTSQDLIEFSASQHHLMADVTSDAVAICGQVVRIIFLHTSGLNAAVKQTKI